jgi:predicted ester cyclase
MLKMLRRRLIQRKSRLQVGITTKEVLSMANLEHNKNGEIVRHFYDQWRAGNVKAAFEFIDPAVVLDGPINPPTYDGWFQSELWFASVAPDARYIVEDLIAGGDKVAVRWRLDGTDEQGQVTGQAGKKISLTGITIQRVASGKVVEHWFSWTNPG